MKNLLSSITANAVKGWFLTLLGLALIATDFLYFYGVIILPSFAPLWVEVTVAFLAGLALIIWPQDKISKYLGDATDLAFKKGGNTNK
jgi:hypothetical protein